jgi:hypothetical protein
MNERNELNERITIKHSMLKTLVNQRVDCIECMGHARILKDSVWLSKELHHCKKLNHWLRIAVNTAFTKDIQCMYVGRASYTLNRITELGKLI